MKIIFLIIVFTVLLFPQERWTKLNGPGGGVIAGLYAKGDTILVGTGYSKALIFYSTNSGKEWKQADIKLNQRFEDFVYSDDGSFLSVSLYNGIYKSYDLDNWEKVFSSRASNEDFWSIGRDMKGNLYAGADNGHIYTSTDYGVSWQHSAYGPGRIQRFFLGDDSVLYAGSYNAILRKEPGGKWMILKPDTIGGFYYGAFTDEENKLFTFTNSRIKRSDDTGKTWVKLDSDGFFKGEGRIEWIYDMVFNKGRMIAACGDETGWFGVGYGIAVSEDKGMTWRWSNNGLPPKFPTAYRLKYSGDNTYLGTNAAGVFKSTDFGESWFPVNNGINAANVRDFVFDEQGTLYTSSWSNGLAKSTDKGETWKVINNGLSNAYMYSILSDDDGVLFAGSDQGLFRSVDKGENWVRTANFGNSYAYRLHKDKQNRIYAITYGYGIYRSSDKGLNWTRLDKGFASTYVFGFAIDSSGNMYAGSRQGYIYKSSDDGENWRKVRNTIHTSSVIERIEAAGNGYMYATTTREGVLRSTDEGESWEQVNNGLGSLTTSPLAIDKNDRIYITTSELKIYQSEDYGGSWSDITDNLKLVAISKIMPDGEYIYLSTDNESMWRSNPDSLTSIAEFETSAPVEYSLSQNYPNPFNPNTIIKYQIPVNGLVSLKIYDILGKEISTLVNEEKSAGRYEVNFNASDLASGVYIYRVKVNEFVETRKMILMK